MPAPKFIDIDGKRFLWRELLQRRREQVAAAARVEQPALFELRACFGHNRYDLCLLWTTYFFALLARACEIAGQIEEALSLLDDALQALS